MSDTPHAYPLRRPVKSRIVGPARQLDGTATTAYRACVSLTCAQCSVEIAPDALFSRRARPQMTHYSIGLVWVPLCVGCRPLQVEGNSGKTMAATLPVDGRDREGWERKIPGLWTYHLAGVPHPYGYMVQYRGAERSQATWDAIVAPGGIDDDVTLAARVPFDVARATIEEHAKIAGRVSREEECHVHGPERGR